MHSAITVTPSQLPDLLPHVAVARPVDHIAARVRVRGGTAPQPATSRPTAHSC